MLRCDGDDNVAMSERPDPRQWKRITVVARKSLVGKPKQDSWNDDCPISNMLYRLVSPANVILLPFRLAGSEVALILGSTFSHEGVGSPSCNTEGVIGNVCLKFL